MQASAVYDTSERTFESDVILASRDATILVDFWASWCGPCKQLGPTLEKIAEESGGRVRLAKVDTEKEVNLAAAFRVQSIPFVVAFQNGRPADAFQGALPEPQVREWLARLGVDLDAAASGESDEDQGEPSAVQRAVAGLRARDIAAIPEHADELGKVEEDDDDFTDAERLLAGLAWFAGDFPAESEAGALAMQAREAWLGGDELGAMQGLLESARADRSFHEEIARRGLVALMHIHAEHEEQNARLRRQLAVVLY